MHLPNLERDSLATAELSRQPTTEAQPKSWAPEESVDASGVVGGHRDGSLRSQSGQRALGGAWRCRSR